MHLIFIEEAHQIKDAIKLKQGDYKLIALNPSVVCALEKEGAEFSIPEDYYRESELSGCWKEFSGIVEGFVKKADEYIRGVLRQNNYLTVELDLMSYNIYPLNAHVQSILMSLYIFSNLVEKESPLKIFLPENDVDTVSSECVALSNESASLGALRLIANKNGIKISAYSTGQKAILIDITKKIARIPLKLKRILSLLSGLPDAIARAVKSRSKTADKKKYLFYYPVNEAQYLMKKMSREGHDVYCFDIGKKEVRRSFGLKKRISINIDRKKSIAIRSILSKSYPALLFEEHLDYKGVKFHSAIEGKLRRYFTETIPELIGLYEGMSEFLSKHDINAVIGGHGQVQVLESALCKAALDLDIDVFSLQHGGNYGYNFVPKFKYSDFDSVCGRYFIGWGEGVSDYSKVHGYKNVKTIPAGSIYLDQLVKNRDMNESVPEKRPRVLYISATLSHKKRSEALGVDYPSNLYLRMQREIIETVNKSGKADLLFKMCPAEAHLKGCINDFIQTRGYKNSKVTVQGSVTGLMKKSDLVLIDIPSTILLEALAIGKKIFVYADKQVLVWEDKSLERLSKSAYVFEEFGVFLAALTEYCSNPERYPVKKNDEFLALYGTYLNDGKSLERVYDLITSN